MITTIHYDITRLLSRASVLTATGQDRLDIRYANYIATNLSAYNLTGLFQHKGVIVLVSSTLTKRIIAQLFNKWILNGCPDDVHATEADTCIQMLRAEILNVTLLKSAPIDTRLDSSNSPTRPAVYINAAFTHNEYGEEFFKYKEISGAKMLFFVYDLLPIEFPEYFKSDTDRRHLSRMINVSRCADIIIPISRDVGEKVNELFQVLNTNIPRIVPIEPGVEEAFLINRNQIAIDQEPLNQFVIVSTIEPRKNHLMLLQIWREFVYSGLEQIPKLYIIGRRGWKNDNVFNFLDNCIALKPYVIELTDAPDDTVISKLSESKASLFPSFGEGWGLPPVESLALGVPTICADIPILREATKGSAMYINPNDYFGWRDKILEISQMTITEFCEKRRELESFHPFEWGAAFEKLRVVIAETARE